MRELITPRDISRDLCELGQMRLLVLFEFLCSAGGKEVKGVEDEENDIVSERSQEEVCTVPVTLPANPGSPPGDPRSDRTEGCPVAA